MTKKFNKKLLIYGIIELAILAALLLADQLTKLLIYDKIDASGKDIILIEGVLRFTAVQNTGASFGIFKGKVKTLAIVSVIALTVLVGFIAYTLKNRNLVLRLSLLLIAAGGIGNQIDRLSLEYVKDFIYFELINYAVFNVADAELVVGTILLVIYIMVFYNGDKDPKKSNTPAQNPPQNANG